MKKRSLGVTIFGILFIVWGVLASLGTVFTASAPKVLPTISVERRDRMSPERQQKLAQAEAFAASPWFGPYIAFAAVASLVLLTSGFGLLMLRSWAWWLTLTASGISLLSQTVSPIIWKGAELQPLRLCFTLSWSGFIIWYFLRPSVKAQFRKGSDKRQVTSNTSNKCQALF